MEEGTVCSMVKWEDGFVGAGIEAVDEVREVCSPCHQKPTTGEMVGGHGGDGAGCSEEEPRPWVSCTKGIDGNKELEEEGFEGEEGKEERRVAGTSCCCR
jgi:hypothetical protein